MSDRIERIMDDAGKSAMGYWNCDEHNTCNECPSRALYPSCVKAQQIDIVNRTHALYGETKEEFSEYGTPVDRPEPEDTQEKIDADAEKSFCERGAE